MYKSLAINLIHYSIHRNRLCFCWSCERDLTIHLSKRMTPPQSWLLHSIITTLLPKYTLYVSPCAADVILEKLHTVLTSEAQINNWGGIFSFFIASTSCSVNLTCVFRTSSFLSSVHEPELVLHSVIQGATPDNWVAVVTSPSATDSPDKIRGKCKTEERRCCCKIHVLNEKTSWPEVWRTG